MGSLKDDAKAYKPEPTPSLADLEQISVDFAIMDGEGVGTDGKPFKYKYVEIDGVEYRVPNSVREQLQAILAAKPDLKFFKVSVTNRGTMKAKYQVIAL